MPEPVLSYEQLVEQVGRLGGLEVPLETTEVCRASFLRFPWLGYGFAWKKRVQGSLDGLPIDLFTSHVVLKKRWRFPYLGYGFAWTEKMRGHIGGHRVVLQATRIDTETRSRFPYRGYGFAWTREMKGACGPDLELLMTTSEVEKEKEWGFPYQGYGFAWGTSFLLKFSQAPARKAVGRGSRFDPIAEFSSARLARTRIPDGSAQSGMDTVLRKLERRPADSWASTTISS